VPHTSFTVCTLWYIDALVAIGRLDEARQLFEHVLSMAAITSGCCCPKDIDPRDGRTLGQLPQTYSPWLDCLGDAAQQELEAAFWRGW